MKALIRSLSFTVVYFLSGPAWGQAQSPRSNLDILCGDRKGAELEACYKRFRDSEDSGKTCNEKVNKLLEAKKEVGKACSESALGKSADCLERADECNEIMSNEVSNVSTDSGGMNIFELSKRCPMTPEEPKEIKKDLEQNEKDLDDAKLKIVETEKKQAEAFEKIQEEISKLDADKETNDKAIQKKKDDSDSNQAKTLPELAKKARDLSASLLQISGAKTSALAEKAQKLAENVKELVISDCDLKAQKSLSSISSSTISNGAQKKRAVNAQYLKCVEGGLRARQDIINIYQNRIEQIDRQYSNVEADIKQTELDMETLKSDTSKAKIGADSEKTTAQKKYDADKVKLANKLQSLFTSSKNETATLNQKVSRLQGKLNTNSSKLTALGNAPSGAKKTFNDVVAAQDSYSEIAKNFDSKCCNAQLMADSTTSCYIKDANERKTKVDKLKSSTGQQ